MFVLNAISWTWGSPEDLWHYLPRILELLAAGELNRYDISGLFTAMSASWRDWPQNQQDAVTSYLIALRRATADPNPPHAKLDVRDVLKAATDLGISIS